MTKGRKSSLEETIGGVNSDGCPASGTTVHVTAEHNGPLKEYDPFEEMSAEKPTTYQETLFNFVKQNLGTGILAMPNAFYHSGYLLGPICMVAIILFSVYCKHLQVSVNMLFQLRVNYALCKKKKVASMSFRDTIGNACAEGPPFFQKLGPHMQVITDLAIVIGQMGTGIVYFVFMASNLKKECDEHYEPLDQRLYMAAILVPLVLMNYLHSYKFLAPISLVTNVVSLAGYGIILCYILSDLRPLAARSAVGTLANIPLFLGTVLFVYEPVSFVIPMRTEMKQPRRFGSKFGVFHVGTVIVSVLYLTMGFFGYLAYGADALGSVTLNLPLREVPATIARLTQCAVIFMSHAIQNYVVFDITWYQWLSRKFKNPRWRTAAEYCFRTAVISLECLLAAAAPQLELVISLLGALAGPLVGFVVPALAHASLDWGAAGGRRRGVVARLGAVALLSALVTCAGVAASLASIAETFE